MYTLDEIREILVQVAISQKETSEKMKETDEQMKKTDAKIDKLANYIGSIGENQGYVAEEFFINTIANSNMEIAGITYDELYKNMYKKTKKAEGEFDIVLVNGKDIAIIETKYKAHLNDVEDFITRKYKNFQTLYPEYQNYHHHLGFASFYIDDETKTFALKNNVMVLQRKGELIETTLP